MSDLRCAWVGDAEPGTEPVTHQVTVEDVEFVGGGRVLTTGVTTDCGIAVTPPADLTLNRPVTCEDCLFGGLDGLLREALREPVLAGARPDRIVVDDPLPAGDGYGRILSPRRVVRRWWRA